MSGWAHFWFICVHWGHESDKNTEPIEICLPVHREVERAENHKAPVARVTVTWFSPSGYLPTAAKIKVTDPA
jgi:hypothetical protein